MSSFYSYFYSKFFIERYKFVGVKPLPEEEALAKGANFLSEAFIFSVAGIVMTLEVWRSDYQSSVKAAAAKVQEAEKNKILDERFKELITMIDDIKESLPLESQKKYERIKKIRNGEPIPIELEPIPTPEPKVEQKVEIEKTLNKTPSFWTWMVSFFS